MTSLEDFEKDLFAPKQRVEEIQETKQPKIVEKEAHSLIPHMLEFDVPFGKETSKFDHYEIPFSTKGDLYAKVSIPVHATKRLKRVRIVLDYED